MDTGCQTWPVGRRCSDACPPSANASTGLRLGSTAGRQVSGPSTAVVRRRCMCVKDRSASLTPAGGRLPVARALPSTAGQLPRSLGVADESVGPAGVADGEVEVVGDGGSDADRSARGTGGAPGAGPSGVEHMVRQEKAPHGFGQGCPATPDASRWAKSSALARGSTAGPRCVWRRSAACARDSSRISGRTTAMELPIGSPSVRKRIRAVVLLSRIHIADLIPL